VVGLVHTHGSPFVRRTRSDGECGAVSPGPAVGSTLAAVPSAAHDRERSQPRWGPSRGKSGACGGRTDLSAGLWILGAGSSPIGHISSLGLVRCSGPSLTPSARARLEDPADAGLAEVGEMLVVRRESMGTGCAPVPRRVNWCQAACDHPSLPNYFELWAGSTFAVTDDGPPAAHPLNGQTLGSQLTAAGIEWAGYFESLLAEQDPTVNRGGRDSKGAHLLQKRCHSWRLLRESSSCSGSDNLTLRRWISVFAQKL
jgi:hypothetical protein